MLGIGEAITSVSTLINTVISRIWPDATEQEKAKLALMQAEMEREFGLMIAQVDVNNAEAQHPSVFVSGARPFILWICGGALAYAAIIEPIARFICVVIAGYTGEFPAIDTEITLQVLLGLLGLGGYRTFEKVKGVARVK